MVKEYMKMREITHEDYLEFIKTHDEVIIGTTKIKLRKIWKIKSYTPDDFTPEHKTVWSFPNRGDWATHKGDYRGNWSPYIPRNLILKYTHKGDWVLDPMMGSGTTLVEAKLLERNAIGIDINLNAVMIARDRLNFSQQSLSTGSKEQAIKTYLGDAKNLNKISNDSIDLIATHPPYANIISYSKKERIEGDISGVPFPEYITEMEEVAKEAFRVLKPGKFCAILIGDTRKHKHYVPISHYILNIFLKVGFILAEEIIKIQWKTKSGREKWRGRNYDFYLISHEHIYVFRKPTDEKERKKLKFSSGNF